MIQDVHHALWRFIEIDGYADSAGPGNRKIRGVPLRAVCRKNSYPVSRFHAKFHERTGKSRDYAEETPPMISLPSGLHGGTFAPVDLAIRRWRLKI